MAASSGSGEMVGREVADNDEFTQTGNEEVITATAGLHEQPSVASLVIYPSAELHRKAFDFKMV